MSSLVNLDKISRNLTASKVLSDVVYVFIPQIKDKPFLTIDNHDTLNGRLLGSGLTAVLTKDYPIGQQRTAVKYTTSAGPQTITYSKTFNLSSNFFNSGFASYLVLPIWILEGASALDAAARTVNLEAVDTAGTPVTFSGGALNYILGDATVGTENLDDYKGVISIPLNSLFSSTTKEFTLTVTFNFPADVEFVAYEYGLYRTFRDSWLLGNEGIIFTTPINISNDAEGEDQEVRGAAGNLLGTKEAVESETVSWEEELYNKEHALVLSGDYLEEGGYEMLPPQTITIPVGGEVTVNQLDNTKKADDIFIEIADDAGRFSEAKVAEGGNSAYLPTKLVRYVREGTKKLRFSAADEGKQARVWVNYVNSSKLTGKKKGIKTKIPGELIRIRANSSSFANATDYIQDRLLLGELTARVLSADISATESVRLSLEFKQIVDNVDAITAERTY